LTRERDETKKMLCEENNVKLFYYTKYKNVEGSDIYKNKDKLLNEIAKYGT